MEIQCKRVGEVTFLNLTGRCAVSPGETELAAFRATIAQLVADHHVQVAVNLAGLQCIDARGLGEFVAAHRTLSANGGGLTLVAASARIRRVLAITGLDTVLRICESQRDIDGTCGSLAARPPAHLSTRVNGLGA